MKLRIEKEVYGGSGLARAEGKAVFVPFTLPGEEVEAAIVSDKGGFANAELQSILESSPARVKPPCQYFGRCGGCHYQHATYAAQVEMKVSILRETLERAHIRDIPEMAAITADPLGYRNRIRLHIRKNPFALCYKMRNSHANLAVTGCPIAAPLLQRAIEVLSRKGESFGFGTSVTEIELFSLPDNSSALMSLWMTHSATSFMDQMSQSLRQNLPEIAGIGIFGVDESRGPGRLAAYTGANCLMYPSGSRHYRVSMGSFFQINRFLIDPLVQLVTGSEKGDSAWDLYAGVGLFSVPLTDSFTLVTAVEPSPPAIRDLRENLRGTKHRIVASDTAAFLRLAIQQRAPAPDLAVVDPPRVGLGLDVTTSLAKIRPRKITYVSCDPATLSRDLAALVKSGYRLERMHLLDLFPQTYHLESVTQLALD